MEYQRNRTATILSGVLAIILGLFLISVPGLAIGTLILFFAIYLILYGIVRLYDSIKAPEGSSYRLPWLVVGAIAVLGGLGLIFYPTISIVLLAYYIAFYVLVIGILEILAGFQVKDNAGKEILIIIAGILSVLFGLYLIINPALGTTLLVLFLGWYSLIYGIILVIYGFTHKPTQSSY